MFCLCLLLLIKVLNKAVEFTVSPTYSMLLFQGRGFEGERDRDRRNPQAPLSNTEFLASGRCCYTSWYPDPDIWSYSIVYCLVQSTITGRKRPQHRNSKKSILDSLFDLMLIGLDIHNEHKSVVVLYFLHG